MSWGCSDLFPTGKVLHFWTFFNTKKNGCFIESTCGLLAKVPDKTTHFFPPDHCYSRPLHNRRCKRCEKGLERIRKILERRS